GSGLLATLGIHHRNKYNSFCLADDIMEPYRPWVDLAVANMMDENMNCLGLDTLSKSRLLKLLGTDILINNKKSPLMVGLSQTTASLSRCFEGKEKKIIYPEIPD